MEAGAKDKDEAVSANTGQDQNNQAEDTGAESPKIQLRPSALLASAKPGDPDQAEAEPGAGPTADDTKFGVSGSKKVIEPSSEFRSEMTNGEAEGSEKAVASNPEASNSDSPAEHHETPLAIRDFINSENTQSAEPADATNSTEPVNEPANTEAQTDVAAPTTPLTASVGTAAPVSSGGQQPAMVSTDTRAGSVQPGIEAGKSSPRGGRGLIWAIIAAIVVIVGAGAFTFLYYLPNRPSAVFASSLSRTGQALDKLVSYSQDNYLADFESFGLNGSVTVNGKNYNLTSSLSGSYDKSGNTTTDLNVNSKTEGNTNTNLKLELGLETIRPQGQTYPDVYFKLAGISDFLDQLGAGRFDKYDGKWIAIGHDLIANYVDGATGAGSNLKSPTRAQIFDAVNKAQAINKAYLFTGDTSKSVLVNRQYVGTETKFGRSTYHYKVGFSKANLSSYVDALASALNSSSLNDWAKASLKHDLVQQSNVSELKGEISKIKDDSTFDMWADRSTKLVGAVQFDQVDGSEKSVITLAQTYNGGDNYPFKMIISGSDGQSKGSLEINLNVNVLSHEAKVDFTYVDDENGDKTTASGNFTISPSSNKVNPAKPASAEPIENVLKELGLGSLSTGDSAVGSNSNVKQSSSMNSKETAITAQAYIEAYASDNTGQYPADQQTFDSWMADPNGGNDATLANQFTPANGFTYTKKSNGYTITYKTSDGKMASLNG